MTAINGGLCNTFLIAVWRVHSRSKYTLLVVKSQNEKFVLRSCDSVAYHNRIYDMSTSAGWNPLRSKKWKMVPSWPFCLSLFSLAGPFFLMSDLHARSSNKGMKECIWVPSESLFFFVLSSGLNGLSSRQRPLATSLLSLLDANLHNFCCLAQNYLFPLSNYSILAVMEF